MKPKQEDHVKCFIKNNNVLEGIVVEWSDSEVVLNSLDGDSTLIIQNPREDIIVVKIIHKDPQIKQKIAEAIKKSEEPSLPINDRARNLADLKILLNKQEKKIIAEKLKDHNISSVKEASYEYPGFLQKQSPK